MPDNWLPAQLGDHVDLLTGFPFKSAQYCVQGEGIRLLRGDNVVQSNLRWDGAKYWPTQMANEFVKYNLRPGDVVLAMDRPWIEAGLKVAALRAADCPSLLVQRVARLRACDGLDQGFLKWLLYSRPFTDHVLAVQTGTAVPHISGRQIRDFRFLLPPLDEQQRIAGVLGGLDDLIDTDRGLVDTLVEQADSVAADFRARGDVTTFGEVCDVFGGATPKTSEPSYWNGDLHWGTPSDITALRSPYLFATSRQITQAGLDACSSELHPPGSILMTSRATIGAFALAQVPTATNQGFIVVEPHREEDRYFLFHEMRRRVPEFVDRANGSTFMEISRGTFKSLSVEWPPESDRRELARKLEPLHRAATELEREVAELESWRDELLPLLLSGRVRVDEVAA
jgi:type I restriction enzyme S subunit